MAIASMQRPYLEEVGLLSKDAKIDPNSAVDDKFLKAAH